ncbi:unnamed protein product, partial [Ilex paraguariensis]
MEKDNLTENAILNSSSTEKEEHLHEVQKEHQDKENVSEKNIVNSSTAEKEGDTPDSQKNDQEKEDSSEKNTVNTPSAENLERKKLDVQRQDDVEPLMEVKSLSIREGSPEVDSEKTLDDFNNKMGESAGLESENVRVTNKNLEEILYEEEEAEPVFDGTEVSGMEGNRSSSTRSLDLDSETQGHAWPEKAVALTNFVREKSAVAVSSVLRRLSGKSDGGQVIPDEEDNNNSNTKEVVDSSKESEAQEASHKTVDRSGWNPLSLIGISRDANAENKAEQRKDFINESALLIAMKGRIILYTRLGCQDCKEARIFLHQKRLRYVEINIDVYPNRKLELEKIGGSSAVPRVFFNEVLIGGLTELKELDGSGKLDEKIEFVMTEGPSFEAPLPPLSGEDDVSSSGAIDELAVIVRKMRESIAVKDRFHKMRRFTNCFLGSEAVDFLSEDQYLEREEVSCWIIFKLRQINFTLLLKSILRRQY